MPYGALTMQRRALRKAMCKKQPSGISTVLSFPQFEVSKQTEKELRNENKQDEAKRIHAMEYEHHVLFLWFSSVTTSNYGGNTDAHECILIAPITFFWRLSACVPTPGTSPSWQRTTITTHSECGITHTYVNFQFNTFASATTSTTLFVLLFSSPPPPTLFPLN